MTKKLKSTKQIRAIDRIIKFQIDDGVESLTISGKEVLADVAIDRQANVTLFLNADPDKINDIQSLVPFVTVKTATGGTETDKTKTVTLSQDLTQFALEIADNSKELASLIKTQSSIVLDLAGLVQQLLEIAQTLAVYGERLDNIETKNQEQDQRLTVLKENNDSQDERLNEIDVTQEAHASKLASLERKNTEQDNRQTTLETTVRNLKLGKDFAGQLQTNNENFIKVVKVGDNLYLDLAGIVGKINALEAKNTQQDQRLNNLENN